MRISVETQEASAQSLPSVQELPVERSRLGSTTALATYAALRRLQIVIAFVPLLRYAIER